jgi:hypothetical protein
MSNTFGAAGSLLARFAVELFRGAESTRFGVEAITYCFSGLRDDLAGDRVTAPKRR